MSSLAISLLILAAAALLAVVAVNLVQAMNRRKRLEAARPKPVEGPADGRAVASADGSDGGADSAGATGGSTGSGGVQPIGQAAPPSANGAERAAAARGAARTSIRTRQEPRLGDVDSSGEHEPEPSFARGSADAASQPAADARAGAAQQPASAAAGSHSGAADIGLGAGSYRAQPVADTAGAASAVPAGAAAVAGTGTGAGAGELRGSQLSPLCDCIVTLPLDSPVGGERLLALTQGARRAGAKPMLVEGVPAGGSNDESLPLSPAAAYRALRLGVLMANRHGPLNAMEYSEFVSTVQQVADHLPALADTPDMADVIARARDLDSTCAQLDAQIGLNVDSPEPLGPAQLDALAGRVGLVDRGGHRYARLGPNGELVFTMSFGDSTQRLAFLLDVPRTARALDGWAAMLDCAQQIAVTLSGRVVDDNGRPIPDTALATIARQLAQRYDSLDSIGLPAGSALAMRVFN